MTTTTTWLSIGTRVRWRGPSDNGGASYRLDADERIGRADGLPGEYAPEVRVPGGTTGTVIRSDGKRVRVLLDGRFREQLPVDEIEWPAEFDLTYKGETEHVSGDPEWFALNCVEAIEGERLVCSRCGGTDFDSDRKHSVEVVFCLGTGERDGELCGIPALEADLSVPVDESRGWRNGHTGGGCRSLWAEVGDFEIHATLDGCVIPERGEDVLLTLYDADWEQVWGGHVTWDEFVSRDAREWVVELAHRAIKHASLRRDGWGWPGM